MDGPAAQWLPVGLPGMAVDNTCSVGPCNSQKCHGVLGTQNGPRHTCSPARVGEAPGSLSQRKARWSVLLHPVFIPCPDGQSCLFSPWTLDGACFLCRETQTLPGPVPFKGKFFVMTPLP